MKINVPLLGFHGCDRSIAQDVVGGRSTLVPSANDYDWLGPGVYFWINAYDRALDWAKRKHSAGQIKQPEVLCAVIDPMNCLNLLDLHQTSELAASYRDLLAVFTAAGLQPPRNGAASHGIAGSRKLDCAVIRNVHAIRARLGLPAYDTVLGAFDEGPPAFPGAAIRTHSHVQIAVLNPRAICRVFTR